jgi:hypothetical protein
MKTQKSRIPSIVTWIAIFLFWPCATYSQNASESELTEVIVRPEQTDTTSQQLIQNYLTITGGRQKHQKIRNIIAEGSIKESTLERRFKLIETSDGKRHLSYQWTHLGRQHLVIYVYDGLQTWTQVLEPQKEEAEVYTGANALHFAHQHWLLQPFTLPMRANFVFEYEGTAKALGRSAYLIKAYGKENLASWFYFDKEQHLLTRWGGQGSIAGVKEYMDYRATAFKSVNGILLPSKMDLLAENAVFGHVQFEQIHMNQNLNNISFLMPQTMIPTLRQRMVAPRN